MSLERMRATVLRAWALLRRDAAAPPAGVRPGRPRDPGRAVSAAETEAVGKPGFAEEALPWLDAVFRFALRLTRDQAAAEDLVQETFLRAFRSWEQFQRGTNCRSWLFTICRHTYLHERERAHVRYEVAGAGVAGEEPAAIPFVDPLTASALPPDAFFNDIVDDELIAAIDALPDDHREVLTLSDLGDLSYPEIADVLNIPVGTVKSRLSRARRQVRERLARSPRFNARTSPLSRPS